MPRVSVIIPTYNHRKYVLSTLQSVFDQSGEVLEVLVVNDGSPDDSARLLAPLAREGKIRYLEQRNHGQAAARNRGLFEARGEFVAFLDDDDLWPPGKLHWQREFLETHCDVGVVAGTAEFFDDAGPRHIFGRAQEITFESLFEGDPVASPGQTLIRTSIARAA